MVKELKQQQHLWKDVLNKRGGRMKAISNFPLNPIDN